MTREELIQPIQFVMDHTRYVSMDKTAIETFVDEYKPVDLEHWRNACPFEYKDLEKVEDEVNFRFVVDSMAFCFWGYPAKWTVQYQELELDGWWAMLAVFKRAIEKGIPVLRGEWLAGMSFNDAKELFVGEPEIPLLKERWEILKKTGEVLVKKYDGRFWNFFKDMEEISALELLDKIVDEFPGWDDVHTYKGKSVRFYKKGQLLVNDLWKVLGIEDRVQIIKLEALTGKADYKIPMILRRFGILKYSDELADMVDNRTEIERGSEMEVEIRAGMIWANELICKKLQEKGHQVTPIQLDNILWVMSQDKSPVDKPYHLTLTIDY